VPSLYCLQGELAVFPGDRITNFFTCEITMPGIATIHSHEANSILFTSSLQMRTLYADYLTNQFPVDAGAQSPAGSHTPITRILASSIDIRSRAISEAVTSLGCRTGITISTSSRASLAASNR